MEAKKEKKVGAGEERRGEKERRDEANDGTDKQTKETREKTIKRRTARGKGGREREEGSLTRPLGFDGQTLGAPTPRRPLDYQSFISELAPEAAGAESSGGPGPLQLPHHEINQHLSAAALTYIIPLCSTVSLLNSKYSCKPHSENWPQICVMFHDFIRYFCCFIFPLCASMGDKVTGLMETQSISAFCLMGNSGI